MIKILQSRWTTALLGGVLYLSVTAYLLMPARVFSRGIPTASESEPRHTTGPSWDYSNPEMDRLMTELAKEKGEVAQRQQQLDELAARLEAERTEINILLQSIQRTQKDFDKNVLRVHEEEALNLKKLAKVYAAMSPEGAAKILRQMDDDQIVKFLVFMKEDETAPLLEGLSKLGEAEEKRAATISDRLRTVIFRHPASKP
jgi:flagellar motility protein MotE (MotC chaperone)